MANIIDMADIEGNVVALLGQNNGELSLDLVKEEYLKRYGEQLPIEQKKLGKTLNGYESLSVAFADSAQLSIVKVATATGRSEQHAEDTEDKIVRLLNAATTQGIALSDLKDIYRKEYKTALPHQTKLSTLINGFDSLKLRKHIKDWFIVLALPEESPLPDLVPVVEDTPDLHADEVLSNILNLLGHGFQPLRVHQDSESVINLLPEYMQTAVEDIVWGITDIALDMGRRPYCWHEDKRHFLSDNESDIVDNEELQEVINKLGRIGSDNRSGIDKQLHRIR